MLGVDSIHPNPRELITMKLTFTLSRPLASTLVGVALALAASTSWGVDASAAESLARRNSCFKCHAASGGGEAPAFKKIAAKYKGQAEAPAKLLTHLKTAPKVKPGGGEDEEEHVIIKAKDDAEINNLIAWILAQ